MIKSLKALRLQAGLVGAALVLAASPSFPAYPDKPIRLVVPFAPGGGTDLIARTLGAGMAAELGQQVLIDNKPGANTVIGSEALARSAPDGYTISLAASTHVTVPHLAANLPFDALRDFTPVAGLVTTQLVLVVHPSVAASNLSEFIALAKARPNELNFAAVGTGSSTHLAGEYFKSVAGVKMQHVPYKGTAPALTDLIGGQIQLNFDTPVTSIPYIKSGRLRALAITGSKRLATLPDVPTFAEAGLPAYDFQLWFGVLAPAGTPGPIVDKLSAEIARILALPEVKQQLAEQGLDTAYRPSAEFDKLIRSDHERFGRLIKSAGIKVE